LDSIKANDYADKLALFDHDELSRGNLLHYFKNDSLENT